MVVLHRPFGVVMGLEDKIVSLKLKIPHLEAEAD